MRKIPTLFVRDENDRRYVTDQVTPGCEWVLAGEGVATRKYDGTCVLFDGGAWFARREVKPGKKAPEGFIEADYDEATGKTVGWEPISQSSFAKLHAEAVEYADEGMPEIGTYELVGPKVNGNPEGVYHHMLVRHADAQTFGATGVPRIYNDLRTLVLALAKDGWEGLVWHHPDGRMAKLKARDFPKAG